MGLLDTIKNLFAPQADTGAQGPVTEDATPEPAPAPQPQEPAGEPAPQQPSMPQQSMPSADDTWETEETE